jgi:uncharacterized membrane protein
MATNDEKPGLVVALAACSILCAVVAMVAFLAEGSVYKLVAFFFAIGFMAFAWAAAHTYKRVPIKPEALPLEK